jgi:predicted permease
MDVWDSYRLTARPRPNGVSDLRTDYGTALWLLLGITGLVLAIACANLANLTLARTLARGREVATRLAIGAERRQVVWQLFSESVLLTLAGSVAGAVLAGILSNALVRFLNSQNIEAVLDLEMDWNVLAALAASAFATCLFFGLSVAIYATREQTLAQAASIDRGSTPDRRRFSFQSILISGQVSVSLVLVASSFLFLKSFENLVTTDAGFRQEGIVYSYLDAGPDDGEAPARVNPEWVDAARSIPGVEAATTSTHRPLNGSGWSLGVRNPETGEDTFPQFTWVSPGYFETMAIPILAGRDITEDDGAGSRRVLLINERFARDYFGEADPIGNRLRSLEEPGFPETVYEVVGVVADTHYRSLRGGIRPIAYAPAAQEPSGQRPMAIVTRSSLPASSLAREVEAAIARVDPDVRTTGTVDLRQEVLQGLSRERILAWLGGFFGLLALTLAGIGLYGVVSYMVAARRREIGIRMALGADRSSVIGMVLGQTTRLTLVGCAGGVGLSLVVMRLAKGLLFGIVPSDPFALSGAATVLTVVALAAAYLPGRVAARTNPVETLRDG